MNTASILIHWYHQNGRDLPWRHTKDPYKIWLSEIILQQTRVEQGMPYYHRFVRQFPNVRKLAAANEQTVLKLWQGLGYYSRARNLHHTAKEIVRLYQGKFPKDYDDILSLKGVGEYTAAAIASFSFNQPYPAIDGNVARFLSRYFGIEKPFNSTGKKIFYEAAGTLMQSIKPEHSSDFNQSIIEFGALQCKPVSPRCNFCPLNSSCHAFIHEKVAVLPVKAAKTVMRNRYLYYFVMRDKSYVYLKKRTADDIWKNLYDFPLIESRKKLAGKKLKEGFREICGEAPIVGRSAEYRHLLSHQRIIATFFEVETNGKQKLPGAKRVPLKQIHTYPVPKLIERYLHTKKNM